MFNADMSLILKKAKINMMALGAFESNKSTKKDKNCTKVAYKSSSQPEEYCKPLKNTSNSSCCIQVKVEVIQHLSKQSLN